MLSLKTKCSYKVIGAILELSSTEKIEFLIFERVWLFGLMGKPS